MSIISGFFDSSQDVKRPITAQTFMSAFAPLGSGVCGPDDLKVSLDSSNQKFTIGEGTARINGAFYERKGETANELINLTEVGTVTSPMYICLRYSSTTKDISIYFTSSIQQNDTFFDIPLAKYVGKSGSITSFEDMRHIIPSIEMGDWKPEFLGVLGDTETKSNGKYIKIGNMVHLFFSLSGYPIAGEENPLSIKGIPFKVSKFDTDDRTSMLAHCLPNAAGSITASGKFGFSNILFVSGLSAGNFSPMIDTDNDYISVVLNGICDMAAAGEIFVAQIVKVYVKEYSESENKSITHITGECTYYTTGERLI